MTGAWRLALRNLRRHRRRNVVTALAVALGYAGLVVLFGYAGWAERLLRTASVYGQHRGHLAISAPGGLKRAEAKPSRHALPVEAQEKILAALRADPRVERAGRYLVGSGVAGNGCKSFQLRAVGVEPELERALAAEPEVVALFGAGAGRAGGRSLFDAFEIDAPVVLAPILARSLEKDRLGPGARRPAPARGVVELVAAPSPRPSPPLRGGEGELHGASAPVQGGGEGELHGASARVQGGGEAPLDCAAPDLPLRLAADPFIQLGARTVDGSFGAVDAQVVGVFHPASTEESKTALVAPLDLLQRLYDTDRVTYVAAYLRDHRDLPAVERDLVRRLQADGVEASLHRYDDRAANPYFVGTMAFLGAMIFFIVLLVTSVVGFSVLNAMTMAAIERAREMGTLRSLGFTRGELTGVFLREAALLTLAAVAAGAALAGLARVLVAAARIRFVPPGSGAEVVLQLLPPPAAWLGTAAFFLVLTVSATWLAVRRKARASVAVLLAEVAA